MKMFALFATGWLAAGPALAVAPVAPAAPTSTVSLDDQKTLYALGVWLSGKVLPFNLTAADLPFVELGLRDTVLGKKPQVDMDQYGNKLNAFAQARLQAAAEKNKAAGKAFAVNAAKEKGAKTTSSGLVYIETKKGKGSAPKADDTVKVIYEGKFINGTVFDSSFNAASKINQPVEFPLNGVIPCWSEAVRKMKVGGVARLICPAAIAYGDLGRPGIPPGSTLDFRIELLEVKPTPKTK